MANVRAIRSERLSKPYDSRYVIVDFQIVVRRKLPIDKKAVK